MRIVSYNTRDFLDDRAAAVRVIRALAPDVLCLQEVPRRLGGGCRVARFAADCGLRTTGRHRGSGGTTILVAPEVEISEVRHRRLPVRWPDRTRGYAVARVLLPGGPWVSIVSVHLGLRPEERIRHAEQILRSLAPPGPHIVCGDLNEDSSGAAWRLIDVPDRMRLVSPTTPTFPAKAPRRLLDVIFASPELSPAEGLPVDLDAGDVRAASDHRPVWVDLGPRRSAD